MQFLTANVQKFIAAARKRPELGGVITTFLPSCSASLRRCGSRQGAEAGCAIERRLRHTSSVHGRSVRQLLQPLRTQWQVYVEAEGEYRTNANNLGQFYIKNKNAEMVPLSTLTKIERQVGPEFTMRYNLFNSAQIIAGPAPGYRSRRQ